MASVIVTPPQLARVRGHLVIGLWLSSALVGCNHQPEKDAIESADAIARQGQVSGEAIAPRLEVRYPAEPGVRYELPTAFPENPMPAYPEALLAARLPPIQMKVRLVINEQGRVAQINTLKAVNDDQQPFFASVQQVVRGWQFLPLVQIRESHETTMLKVGEFTGAYPGKAVPLPFHQDYVFEFRQVDGKPSVSARQ